MGRTQQTVKEKAAHRVKKALAAGITAAAIGDILAVAPAAPKTKASKKSTKHASTKGDRVLKVVEKTHKPEKIHRKKKSRVAFAEPEVDLDAEGAEDEGVEDEEFDDGVGDVSSEGPKGKKKRRWSQNTIFGREYRDLNRATENGENLSAHAPMVRLIRALGTEFFGTETDDAPRFTKGALKQLHDAAENHLHTKLVCSYLYTRQAGRVKLQLEDMDAHTEGARLWSGALVQVTPGFNERCAQREGKFSAAVKSSRRRSGKGYRKARRAAATIAALGNVDSEEGTGEGETGEMVE